MTVSALESQSHVDLGWMWVVEDETLAGKGAWGRAEIGRFLGITGVASSSGKLGTKRIAKEDWLVCEIYNHVIGSGGSLL